MYDGPPRGKGTDKHLPNTTLSGAGGVLIRAHRVGNDIAIDRIDGQVIGARDLGVAGIQSYQTTNVTGALRDTMLAEAAAWMLNAPAISARLGNTGFEIRPGISVARDRKSTRLNSSH